MPSCERLRLAALIASMVGVVFGARPALADAYAYMGTASDDFGVIDLSTGSFTACGNSGLLLSGLGVGPDGNLYGGAYGQDILYRIDKTSGHLTAIANSNITYFDFGSTLKGLYAVDTTLTHPLISL